MEARFVVCTSAVLLLCCMPLGFCLKLEDVDEQTRYVCGDGLDMKVRVDTVKCMEDRVNSRVLAVWDECRDAHLPGNRNEREKHVQGLCYGIATEPPNEFKKCLISRMAQLNQDDLTNIKENFKVCTKTR